MISPSTSLRGRAYYSFRYASLGIGVTLVLAVALIGDVLLLQQSTNEGISRGMSTTVTRQVKRSSNCDFKYPIKKEPDGLKLAWIMSFPNSGTSYTSELIRDATKTDSATNYADETPAGETGYRQPVYDDMPEGPFWVKADENPDYVKPTEYAVTKTHCGIRCTMCPPEKYAETTYSFREKCFATKWVDFNQTSKTYERVFSSYQADRLTKAIHLIRNPFDNIVSRFHNERELPDRLAAQYSKSRDGFREYCKAIAKLHTPNEKRILFLSDTLIDIMKEVPCHADFFRYVEWHNLAFVTTRDLELNTHVLHYDWYNTRFDQTTKDLLDFLELPVPKDVKWNPFIKGKEYDYFTSKEKKAVVKAMEMMSSPETWSHMKLYFEFDVNDTGKNHLTTKTLDTERAAEPLQAASTLTKSREALK
jgi:Sulfotransferase domain